MAGAEYVEHQTGPFQALVDGQGDQRRAGVGSRTGHGGEGAVRFADRADRHPAGRAAAQCPVEAADVVGVQVAEHHEGEAGDPESVEAGVDGAGVGAGVDQHRATGVTGGQHDRVALADVAGDRGPPGRRPARRDEAGGHQHQGQPEQHREQQRPTAGCPTSGRPPDQRPRDHDRGEQQRAADPVGPRQRGARDRRGPVADLHQPADRGAGEPGARLRRRRAQRRHERGQHPEHRGRGDGRGREQVGQHRDRRHLPAQARDHRRGGQEGRRRDRERLRHPPGCPAPAQGCRPLRGEQHQRGRGQHGQREPGVDGQRRIDHQQQQHGHSQRGHRRPAPAQCEGQQHHRAHHRGPHDAGGGPRQDDEAGDRRRAEAGRPPGVGAQQPQQGKYRAGDDGQVRARHRGEVGEAGGAEVVLHLGGHRPGVTDGQPGQQPAGPVGQHGGRVAQAGAQGSRRGLPPRRSGDVAGWGADAEHRQGEVRPAGRREQALGRGGLARKEPGPVVGRGDQQHPATGRPPAVLRLCLVEDGGHQHLGLPAGHDGTDRSRVVAQHHAQRGRRTGLGRRTQRVQVDQRGVCRDHQSGGRDAARRRQPDGSGSTSPQPGHRGHHGDHSAADGPETQPHQHRGPRGERRGHQPQVRRAAHVLRGRHDSSSAGGNTSVVTTPPRAPGAGRTGARRYPRPPGAARRG